MLCEPIDQNCSNYRIAIIELLSPRQHLYSLFNLLGSAKGLALGQKVARFRCSCGSLRNQSFQITQFGILGELALGEF